MSRSVGDRRHRPRSEPVRGEQEMERYSTEDLPSDPTGAPLQEAVGGRILVADANASVRTSITRLLRVRYEVTAVADGAEALRSAREDAPDLILCDVVMPTMDGFDLLRALRADRGLREIPVILLSARTDESLKIRGLEEGAADYLTKPYTPRELMGRIGAHLKLAAMRREELLSEARARRQAEEANQAKSKFLTTMSHELRTPLNAIAGYVEILQLGIYGPVTDEQKDALERIQQSQRHLLSLMNDVLDFAKLEAGRTHFAPSDVSLHDMLATLESMIAPQLIKKGLEYRYESCGPGTTLRIDVDRLRQVTLNLLSNAIKFTPRGGKITLSCDCVSRPKLVVIQVRDTGVGIPAEKIDAIFEPFIQVNPGEADESAGTGLGLAISRDLAHAMGGTLTVESSPGRGSTFTLSVPRKVELSSSRT